MSSLGTWISQVNKKYATAGCLLGLSSLCLLTGILLAASVPPGAPGWPDFWSEFQSSAIYLAYAVVGALVVARHPENLIGWLFSAVGLSSQIRALAAGILIYSAATTPELYAAMAPYASLPLNLWVAQTALIALILLIYPTGKLYSPRMRPLVWLVLLWMADNLLFSTGTLIAEPVPFEYPPPYRLLGIRADPGFLNYNEKSTFFILALVMLTGIAIVLVQLYQLEGERRQQLKWLVYATGWYVFTLILLSLMHLWPGTRALDPAALYPALMFLGIPSALAEIFIPVATGFAILRYRLWDIDVLIRGTLAYGAVSGVLTAVYFAGIAVLQAIFSFLTGQRQPQVVIILSTLAIAALFHPLRRRVQENLNPQFTYLWLKRKI